MSNRVQEAQLLLKHGYDIELQDKKDDALLHVASRYGPLKMLHLLLKSNACPTSGNKKGETPAEVIGEHNLGELCSQELASRCTENKQANQELLFLFAQRAQTGFLFDIDKEATRQTSHFSLAMTSNEG